MDINKWKSVAIRIEDYKILKSLCGHGVRTASDDVIISGGMAGQIGSFALGQALG